MRDFSFKMQHMTNFSSDLQQIARKTAPDWKTEKYKNTNKSRKNIASARNCMEVSPTFLQGECCAWHMPWHGPQDHDAWVDSGLQPCLAIWLCSTTLSTTSVWCWMAIIQTYNIIQYDIYSYYMLLLRFRKLLSSQKSCHQKSTCFISNSIQVKAFTFSWDSSNSKVTRTWPSKDGFITNMVVYPSICAVFGYDIRQAIGGDFGFSRRAAEAFLAQTWPAKVFGLRKPATQAENDTTFDGQSGGCKPYMFLKQVFSCVYLKLLYSLYIIIIRYSVFWEWSVFPSFCLATRWRNTALISSWQRRCSSADIRWLKWSCHPKSTAQTCQKSRTCSPRSGWFNTNFVSVFFGKFAEHFTSYQKWSTGQMLCQCQCHVPQNQLFVPEWFFEVGRWLKLGYWKRDE